MNSVPIPFTVADWALLPEGFPAQLVEGELLREAAPNFGSEFKVSLPLALQPSHHLVFTFTHVDCAVKDKVKRNNMLGYAVFPMYAANMVSVSCVCFHCELIPLRRLLFAPA